MGDAKQALEMFDFLFLGHGVVNGRDGSLQELMSTDRAGRVKRPGARKIRELEDELEKYLRQEWHAESGATADQVLQAIANGNGDLTPDEIRNGLKYLENELGAKFGAAQAKQLKTLLSSAYDVGRIAFVKSPTFNLIDAQAKSFLAQHDQFWIGQHYGESVGPRISSVVNKTVIEQGLGRVDAANALKEIFTDELGERSDNYWRVVAANATTKARNYGSVESFVEGDFKKFVVLAMMDERTSNICQEMNGKVFDTAWAVSQRDKTMAAATPAEAKLAHRWVTYQDVVGRTAKELFDNGICMPPYHGNCRTILIAE